MMEFSPGRLTGMAFIAAGLICLTVSACVFHDRAGFMKHSLTAEGRVISIKTREDAEGEERFYPLIRFATRDDRRIELTERKGSEFPLFHVGQTVRIRYLPSKPERCYIDRFRYIWLDVIAPASLGFFLAAFGFWAFQVLEKFSPPSGGKS